MVAANPVVAVSLPVVVSTPVIMSPMPASVSIVPHERRHKPVGRIIRIAKERQAVNLHPLIVEAIKPPVRYRLECCASYPEVDLSVVVVIPATPNIFRPLAFGAGNGHGCEPDGGEQKKAAEHGISPVNKGNLQALGIWTPSQIIAHFRKARADCCQARLCVISCDLASDS